MPAAAIWWIRRDLRLNDNPTLQAALQGQRPVIPVFILDPVLLHPQAENRQGFLFAGLRDLAAELNARGSRLIVRQGQPAAELARLCQETGASAIFAAADASPYAHRRDSLVAHELPLQLVEGSTTVFPIGAVRKPDGSPYTIFTPYSKTWKALPAPGGLTEAPTRLPGVPPLASLPIPSATAPGAFPAGENEAQQRLAAFLAGPVAQYAEDRNRMDLPGTALLSPYFRFGMLSARRAALAARAAPAGAQAGAEIWLNELIWREFYLNILENFPHVLRTAFNPTLRAIPWRNVSAELQAWQYGQTGYPVVDAAMRQLLATGWMHNRARMIVASFLVKNLLIDWQLGEAWFMRLLVDGDPAANNGGWQWTAGVGTDAAPYFRIFNPVLQGQKFDPQGEYIRRWVPELADWPDASPLRRTLGVSSPPQGGSEHIHTPWLEPENHAASGYPAPMVDLSQTRARALAAYGASKG